MAAAGGAKHHLETAGADTPVWLVKVPKFLAAKWKEAAEESGPGAVLGSIRFKPGTAEQPGPKAPESFTLHASAMADADLPAEYEMNELSSSADHTHIFSTGPDGDKALTGKVAKKFDARPIRKLTEKNDWDKNWGKVDIDPAYCKLARQRYEAANQKHKIISDFSDAKGHIVNLPKFSGKLPVKTTKGEKNVRMEKDDLERMLFGLFERQEHWSFSDLLDEAEQPAVWLRQVLQSIAAVNKKGEHKGLYELKPEYKVGS